MDTNSNPSALLTAEDFVVILKRIFNIAPDAVITDDTDLAQYIVDSIDLGELLAVLQEEQGIIPPKPEFFAKYSKFKDVLAVLNGTLAS